MPENTKTAKNVNVALGNSESVQAFASDLGRLAKEHSTTQGSLLIELAHWAMGHDDFGFDQLDLVRRRHGRAVNVDKIADKLNDPDAMRQMVALLQAKLSVE